MPGLDDSQAEYGKQRQVAEMLRVPWRLTLAGLEGPNFYASCGGVEREMAKSHKREVAQGDAAGKG